MISRRRIFHSVFAPQAEKTLPTPQATPLIGSGSFSATFAHTPQDIQSLFANADRAWYLVLEYLSLPQKAITLDDVLGNDNWKPAWRKSPSQEVRQAVQYLYHPASDSSVSIEGMHVWYVQEFSKHYRQFQLPGLLSLLEHGDSLRSVFLLLRTIQEIYMHPWMQLYDTKSGSSGPEVLRMQQAFHALISISLDSISLSGILKTQLQSVIKAHVDQMFGLINSSKIKDGPVKVMEQQAASSSLQELLTNVAAVGLGGHFAQEILAEVMRESLVEHIKQCYQKKWESPSNAPQEIEAWIERSWSHLVSESLHQLNQPKDKDSKPVNFLAVTDEAHLVKRRADVWISHEDVKSWKAQGSMELGLLRSKELFNVIVEWPESQGAIEELKYCTTSPDFRTYLTSNFQLELSDRLLQPGASTSQILQFYISLIAAFAILDPRGVLLNRVARPIQRYLRQREDTVKLIVTGFLADPEDEDDSSALSILATLLTEATQAHADGHQSGPNWDDMDWMPDPIDAEPEYKNSNFTDVIENLISLWDTRDVFVKEFQNILGNRLLVAKDDFDAETRLLELLKIRFGDATLQACEVMLRDVSDSVRIDAWVKREQKPAIDVSVKVLSRLFWPELHTESFKVPSPIGDLQRAYSAGFEQYKNSRKLGWLDTLGEVLVELELEDRTVVEAVKIPQAAVIYAFQNADDEAVSKTAEQLTEELEMDEDLVTNSLLFWVGKLVLVKSESATYSVLERLPSSIERQSQHDGTDPASSLVAAAAVASATAAAASISAVRSEEDTTEERMQIYWQFILGMLTNQGALPLPRIVMMLKIAMAGGFPYSNDELKTFLGRRIDDGVLELVGGSYRLIKPAL